VPVGGIDPTAAAGSAIVPIAAAARIPLQVLVFNCPLFVLT
jgi:hypothetical protein